MTQPQIPSAAALKRAADFLDANKTGLLDGYSKVRELAWLIEDFAAQAVAAARVAWEQPTDESDLNLVPHRKITRTMAAERSSLRDCNICGGLVDLSNAKKPPMNFEMSGRTKPQLEGKEHQPTLSHDDISQIERISTRQMVRQMVPIVAAERAKSAASDHEAAKAVVQEWMQKTSAEGWLVEELEDLDSIIAAALAERGRVEREAIAKWHDEQAQAFIDAHPDMFSRTVEWHRDCAAAIRNQTED